MRIFYIEAVLFSFGVDWGIVFCLSGTDDIKYHSNKRGDWKGVGDWHGTIASEGYHSHHNQKYHSNKRGNWKGVGDWHGTTTSEGGFVGFWLIHKVLNKPQSAGRRAEGLTACEWSPLKTRYLIY